jgi:hypothetical protein
MKNSVQADYSELEQELSEALGSAGDEKLRRIKELMIQMAESSPRKHVVISSYPACNSEV